MEPGQIIFAGQLSGDFQLPEDKSQKLAFIAGGIGVTPFRSMVKDLVDRGEYRDVVMFYGNNKIDEIAYSDVFDSASNSIGLRCIYSVAEKGSGVQGFYEGFIDKTLIALVAPDYQQRIFYLSGPRSMVLRFESELKYLGVNASRIKTDFFPGFA